MRGGALVEIVNRGTATEVSWSPWGFNLKCGYSHNNTLASGINSEPADFDSMLVLDRLDVGGFTNDLDKLLAGVSVLVNLANLSRSHLLRQGDVDGQLDTAEPGSAVIGSVYDSQKKKEEV